MQGGVLHTAGHQRWSQLLLPVEESQGFPCECPSFLISKTFWINTERFGVVSAFEKSSKPSVHIDLHKRCLLTGKAD